MTIDLLQTSILAVAFVAFFLTDALFIVRYERQRESRSWRLGYWLLSLLFATLLTLQPLLFPWLGLRIVGPWSVWLLVLGMLLVVASLALQIWARLHLGRFYAERADVQSDHHVVSTGPYAYVRHPLFSSYFLFVIGLLFIAPNMIMLGGLIYTFIDFSQAAKRDEQIMLDHVPGYAAYMARTPRFVPRLLALSVAPTTKAKS